MDGNDCNFKFCVFVFYNLFSVFQDSSFPMAAFIWEVENQGSEELDVAITFTFKVISIVYEHNETEHTMRLNTR